MFRLADPWVLLALVVPLIAWWLRRDRAPETLPVAWQAGLDDVPITPRVRWMRARPWLLPVGFGLVVLALARPQKATGREDIKLKSRNILVAIDISSSMKAKDFQPENRLTAARGILRDFVLRREGDLVGLVIFSGRAFLQAPLSADVHLIGDFLTNSEIGQLPDGTAIGAAIALSLNQLKHLPPAASCIVVITDGAENAGKPTLAEATEMARALGVKIYAIGLTSSDTTSVALNGVWSVRDKSGRLTPRDEAVLRRVADRTGGRFSRAASSDALKEIMDGIDPLERQDVTVQETRRWSELYVWPLALGLLLLVADRLLAATWLRTSP
jgi:Ca-activated chloride channel family protein